MPDFIKSHRLTEEASLKMITAGVDRANALGCKVSLAVVDQSCRLIGFLMMEGARHFSIITTQRKAITSASQRMPTGYAPEENAISMTVRMGDFTNVPGGFPITVNGEVIGAVAAGGAKIEQDVEVAKAALAALGLLASATALLRWARGSTRASILTKRERSKMMDCRVKPWHDDGLYALTLRKNSKRRAGAESPVCSATGTSQYSARGRHSSR